MTRLDELLARLGAEAERIKRMVLLADIRDGRAILLRKGPRRQKGAHYFVKLRSGRWIKVLVGKAQDADLCAAVVIDHLSGEKEQTA